MISVLSECCCKYINCSISILPKYELVGHWGLYDYSIYGKYYYVDEVNYISTEINIIIGGISEVFTVFDFPFGVRVEAGSKYPNFMPPEWYPLPCNLIVVDNFLSTNYDVYRDNFYIYSYILNFLLLKYNAIIKF